MSVRDGGPRGSLPSLQIKRKRNENPVQTLYVRETAKRTRRGSVVFRLAGTFGPEISQGTSSGNVELEPAGSDSVFKLSKPVKDDDEIPADLQEMLNQYLSSETSNKPSPASADLETEDYVYDVYYGEQEVDLKSDEGRVGYIHLESGDELTLKPHESSEDEDIDSEDSNAEDFYRNDYPDESDNSQRSDSLEELDELVGELDEYNFSDYGNSGD